METVKFKKPGQKIVFKAKGNKTITEADLTVEIARKLIQDNRNYERLFEFGNDEGKEVKIVKPEKKKD
jgi:Fe2+ transport system protein FeoA